MPYQLGMPTLIELETLLQNIVLCRRLGLSFIELHHNLPQFLPERLDPEVLRLLSGKTGLTFTAHLPEEIDLGHFSLEIRQGHAAYCRRAIEWAGRAGIVKLVLHLHPGVYFTLPQGKAWVYERNHERFKANLLETFRELSALASANNVTLCLENTGHFHQDFMRRAAEQLLSCDAVKLAWDVGHDAAVNFVETDFFTEHLDRVAHMHLHDWDGRDSHRALYDGKADIGRFLDIASQQNLSVVIEVKTVEALERSVRALRERGRA